MGSPTLKATKACKRCSAIFTRDTRALYCDNCVYKSCLDSGGSVAHGLVSAAIRNGDLVPAKKFACVDCGNPARDYDHRDYNKPLDVQPVCRSCNKLRGPAIPLVTSKAGRAAAAA